jgi:hypothetical protein
METGDERHAIFVELMLGGNLMRVMLTTSLQAVSA